MNRRQLGKSDLYVSEIGFGAMSLDVRDEKTSIRILHEAIDRGINFIDTADLYERGRNEELVGKALKGKRDRVVLATKVGNRWEECKEGWYWGPNKAYIKEAIQHSLKRLQTDYVDLYQLHGGTLEDPIDEIIEAFEELKEAGYIRYYGISSIRPAVIRQYVKRSNIVSVMSQYSILDRRPEESVFPLLLEHNIGVIARGPIAQGVLSSRGEEKITEKGYLDYSPHELRELLHQLKSLVRPERSIEQIALKYVLAHPAITTTIPGASRMEQLLQNLKTIELDHLNSDEMAYIQAKSKANRYEQHR